MAQDKQTPTNALPITRDSVSVRSKRRGRPGERAAITAKVNADLRFQLKMKALEGGWLMEEVLEELLAVWIAGRASPVLALGQHELQARDFSHLRHPPKR